MVYRSEVFHIPEILNSAQQVPYKRDGSHVSFMEDEQLADEVQIARYCDGPGTAGHR